VDQSWFEMHLGVRRTMKTAHQQHADRSVVHRALPERIDKGFIGAHAVSFQATEELR
jgi:hypothetical protein